MIFSHKWSFSSVDWSVALNIKHFFTHINQTLIFSMKPGASKFIEITGNPSIFYVSDCYRRHYRVRVKYVCQGGVIAGFAMAMQGRI